VTKSIASALLGLLERGAPTETCR